MTTLSDGLRNIIAGADPDDPEDVLIRLLLVEAIATRGRARGRTAPRRAACLPHRDAARNGRRRPSPR